MAKSDLPSIAGDLAAPKRVNLKSLPPRDGLDDEAVADNSRRLGKAWNASTSLPADTTEEGRGVPTEPPVRFTLALPAYLDQQLAMAAVQRVPRVTKQHLIFAALKAAGYEVHEDDLRPDRRRAK